MEETQSSGTTAEEIDLLDLMKKIWARRIFVLKAAGIGAIAGLIIAFSIPKEYTTTVKMAPEGINATKGGGMADLAALAGFDLSSGSGNNVDGINLMLYPDVSQQHPFYGGSESDSRTGKENAGNDVALRLRRHPITFSPGGSTCWPYREKSSDGFLLRKKKKKQTA